MLTQLPAELIAGDTWSWSRSFDGYPAGTWASTVYFENSEGTFSQIGTASGTDHVFTLAASTTAGKKAGRYRWSVRVTSAGVSTTVESGWVDVRIDPAAAGNSDPRSWARRALDAVETFLEGNASTAQQSFTIGGRAVSRWSVKELMDWRDRLRTEVRSEESSGSGASGRDIKMRLSRG